MSQITSTVFKRVRELLQNQVLVILVQPAPLTELCNINSNKRRKVQNRSKHVHFKMPFF